MTLSEIQDQINDFIVANGNNEITADVLRPILLGIVGQPNELIGDLANLNTTEQSSLVAAINEINASLANAGGITIHTGADTPLVTPPGSYSTGDFYLQEVASVAVSFWQFNGINWVEIKNVIDDANTSESTTWSSEKIQQAINERDGFITLGAIAYTDNSATIPAGAEWRIAGVTYTSPAEVILSINPATPGYYRTDIIVANTSNTFQIVEGTESTGTVAPAATPANTVKADEINIYGAAVVSTGPGGGFINVVGFFDYNDEATQTTPIAFSTGVPVKLTNDTLGPFTNLTEGPYGVTTVWDPINNRFNFSQLTVGDTIDLRIDLDVTTAGANQTVKVYLKMGAGSPSEYDLPIWDTTYKTAAEHNVGKYTGLYIGSEDIRDYPAELYLVSNDGSGTVKVNGWYPRIIRKGVNVYTLAVSDQDYVKKQFAGSYEYTEEGDNVVLELQPQGYSNLLLTGPGLNSVDGFSLGLITGVPGAYIPYEGKILKIHNLTGSDVTLANGGTADIPFSFRGGEDIIIPLGEFICLDYNILGCVDGLRSWAGEAPSLQEVTDVGNSTTNYIELPMLRLKQGILEVDLSADVLTESRELFAPDENGTIATREWSNTNKQDKLTEVNFGAFMDLDLATKLTPMSGDFLLGRDILTNEAVEIPFSAVQPVLVSGTNIKTINGASVLGSGNLVISNKKSIEYNVASLCTYNFPATSNWTSQGGNNGMGAYGSARGDSGNSNFLTLIASANFTKVIGGIAPYNMKLTSTGSFVTPEVNLVGGDLKLSVGYIEFNYSTGVVTNATLVDTGTYTPATGGRVDLREDFGGEITIPKGAIWCYSWAHTKTSAVSGVYIQTILNFEEV